jgi:predicted O-methyltransferase YrrM
VTIHPGLPRYRDLDDYPPLVGAAVEATRALGYEKACVPDVGALLRVLAAAATRIGETGTACGVGAAWLASGMGDAATLVTVELDARAATAAAALLAVDRRVTVLHADAHTLRAHAPFDLLFTDGGFAKSDPGPILDLVSAGGTVMMDDLTPEHAWGEQLHAKHGEWQDDPVRAAWRATGVALAEVQVTRDESVLLAVKPH